ncbi:MAG: hypothetical protein NCW75_05675 [Phycisphaera sp.]|nr:MAG: hypothetical protein NCW75_05675 [Phycisphaera sp.]
MNHREEIKAKIEIVRSIVLEHFGVSEAEFCGRGRHKWVVRAREAFVIVAYRHTRGSWPDVARAMKPDGAQYNHSTALTAARRAEPKLQTDPTFAEEIEILEWKIQAVQPPEMYRPAQLRIDRAPAPASGPYRVEGQGNPIAVEGGAS